MKKTLLTSPAGRGKTTHLIEQYARVFNETNSGLENKSYFILSTKEHAYWITERIIKVLGSDAKEQKCGVFNPQVITINDFVNQETIGSHAEMVNDVLRTHFIHTISQDHSIPLTYYDQARTLAGFPELVSNFIKELKTSFIEYDDFVKLIACISKKEHPLLCTKLNDISLIYKLYQNMIGKKCDYASGIRRYIEEKKNKPANKNLFDLIIFDGFYHFTPAQCELIKMISRMCNEVIVSLTIDSDRPGLFSYVNATRELLLSTGYGFKEKVLSGKNKRIEYKKKPIEFYSPSLDHLEKHIFSQDDVIPMCDSRDIRIFEATGVSGELEMIVREIMYLIEHPDEVGLKELRYTDFCILFRSLMGFDNEVRTVFKKYDIPVEIHERRKLNMNPFIKNVIHLIQFFLNVNPQDHIGEALKSSYFSFFSDGESKIVNEYINKNPRKNRDEYLALNDMKDCPSVVKEYIEIVRRIIVDIEKAASYHDMGLIITAFIDKYTIFSNTSRIRTDPLFLFEREDNIAYRELRGIICNLGQYDKGIINKTSKRFYELMLGGIEAGLYSLRDNNRNKVQVYDIATAIQKEYRVIFIGGLLEKGFPKQIFEDPILRDSERHMLNSIVPGSFELRIPDRCAGERYLFYMALSRASRRLYLSYPKFDRDGNIAMPSLFVREVEKLFPDEKHTISKKEKDVGSIIPVFSEAVCERDLIKRSVYVMSHKDAQDDTAGHAVAEQLYAHFNITKNYGLDCKTGFSAYSFYPFLLSGNAKTFCAKNAQMPLSPSALGTFARCPYKYFLRYILGLKEDSFGIDYAGIGTAIHETLKVFYDSLNGKRLDEYFGKKNSDKKAVCDQIMCVLEDVLVEKDNEAAIKGSDVDQAIATEYMRRVLRDYIDHEYLCEQNRPHMRPILFEREFHVTVDGINLRGTIDRVDLYRFDNTNTTIVVDYKTGAKKWNPKDVRDGVDLQIPIYIMAVDGAAIPEIKDAHCAGGEIYNLKTGVRNGMYTDQGFELSGKKQTKMSQRYEEYIEIALKYIKEHHSDISSGMIAPNPYPGTCNMCSWNDICRYPYTKQKIDRWQNNKQMIKKKSEYI